MGFTVGLFHPVNSDLNIDGDLPWQNSVKNHLKQIHDKWKYGPLLITSFWAHFICLWNAEVAPPVYQEWTQHRREIVPPSPVVEKHDFLVVNLDNEDTPYTWSKSKMKIYDST